MSLISKITQGGLLKKQNLRLATEIVDDLSKYITNGTVSKQFIETSINNALKDMSEKDQEFANLILSLLKMSTPT